MKNKAASRNNKNKQGNWIGGGEFDEKDFGEGQQWKIMRK